MRFSGPTFFACAALSIPFAVLAAGTQAPPDQWTCSATFALGANSIAYTGFGLSQSSALNDARARCRIMNPLYNSGCGKAMFPPNCKSGPSCRVVGGGGQYDHHHNYCRATNTGPYPPFIGYDPTPEHGPLKQGVCYREAACEKYRPGIDLY